MSGNNLAGTAGRVGATAVAVALVLGLALAGGAVGPAVAQETNTTATPAETPAAEACEPSADEPQLSQSRLYTQQQTITSGESGQIAGGFQVAADSNCPVTVSITMSVPSGMSIAGSSDIVSAGAGLATAQFAVEPGEIKDIRANVYSQNTGDRTVTADITYWPEGHQDMSREIDGISLTFDVEEPNTPAGETGGQDGNATGPNAGGGVLSNTMLLAFGGFALVVLGIVAVATRSESVKIGISK
jgi:hypothetical protein